MNEKKSLQNRTLLRAGVATALLAALCYGVLFYRHAMTHESTDDAYVDGHISRVSPRVPGHITAVRVQDNQWVEKGTVLVELDPADYRIRLDAALAELAAARTAARMRDVDVDLSDIASRSGLSDAQASVDAARANVEMAQAQVATAESRCREIGIEIKTAELDLALARSDMDAARAENTRNQSDLARYREMAESQTVSEQQVEHMAAEADVSRANLEAARNKIRSRENGIQQYKASLDTAQKQLAQSRARLKASRSELAKSQAGLLAAQAGPKQVDQSRTRTGSAKADIDKAEASVAQARLDLARTKVIAETSGFVANRTAETGMFVQTGQSLLALVSKGVWVTANFKETQLARIRPGQPADIAIDAYPDRIFHGRVDSVQHGTGSQFSLLPSENATGNFVKVVQRVPVKILLNSDHGDLPLMPGMSAVPEIDIAADPSGYETVGQITTFDPPTGKASDGARP